MQALANASAHIDPARLGQRGPRPGGVRSTTVADPGDRDRSLPIDVWYPARETHAASAADASQWAAHPFHQPHRALADAAPSSATAPLVLFSHGNSGLRQQSTFLTTHLASWGFVVAAPDHVGNTFAEMQGIDDERRKDMHRAARVARPNDLVATLDHVVALAAAADGQLPPVRADRVAALGHSFGGWTALKMPARDARFGAVCALAPAAEPFVGRRAFAEGDLPLPRATPALLAAGMEDVLVELEASVLSLFRRLVDPRAVIGIEGADHFHFCDGIPLLHGVHEATPRPGLQQSVRPYAELLDEATAHRVLCHVVTAFLDRALLSDDDPCAAFRDATAWRGTPVRPLG